MDNATLVAFALYLFGLFAIAVQAWRRTHDVSDYALGGRGLGPAVAALSAGASDMSGWLLLGLPGAIYASGLVEGWIVVGLVLGAFANWRLVAAPLRRASAADASGGDAPEDSLTLPSWFAAHLRHTAPETDARLLLAVRAVATTLILFFFTFYVASGLVAGARLFEATLDLDYHLALGIGALVIVAYTVAGGFLAVAWTDFFQGLLMLAALVAVPVMLFGWGEGLGGSLDGVPMRGEVGLDAFEGLTVMGWVSLVAWGLGYFGQPHVLARFMAIESADAVPRATAIGMGWMLIVSAAAVGVGLGGQLVFPVPLDNAESVFIELTAALFHPLVAGTVLAAILAAVMSTIDSQLLVASTSLAEDLYRPLRGREASPRELVNVGRAAVLAVALLAIALALDPDSLVLSLVSYAWAGLGASFGPLVLAALYWPRLTAHGALAGMLVGGITVVVWGELSGGLFDLYEIVPGFLFACIAIALCGRRR
ncbi:MAG: sodium/proline symporter PutP [Pseudomonadales bacterium]|nr:sodium/proline symporter PutP [Pseudomonadales bacterium]